MAEEYNLCGIILQPFYKNTIFGGGFEHDLKSECVQGQLLDVWGRSEIKGQLTFSKGVFEFEKRYANRDPINYIFRKKGSLWVGNYQGFDCGRGESLCEIVKKENFFELNWEQIAKERRIGPQTVEEHTKFIIQKMVEKGYLIASKDPETGEEMLSIVKN